MIRLLERCGFEIKHLLEAQAPATEMSTRESEFFDPQVPRHSLTAAGPVAELCPAMVITWDGTEFSCELLVTRTPAVGAP
jgi:hypothetical protein